MSDIHDFMFEGGAVGYFEDAEYPVAAGKYRYMPYRSGSHFAMHEQLRSFGRAICSYDIGDERVTFAVTDCPEYGMLELTDFNRATKPLFRIAGQNWHEELIDGVWRRIRWLGPKVERNLENQ